MADKKSQRFIKFIPSSETDYLQKNHPNSFLLLCLIARRARFIKGQPDGLEIGEALIGDYKEAGIETEMKYRTAKAILVKRQHLKIIETSRKRKNATIGITTHGTKVKILRSDVWDVNIFVDNDPINDRITTGQRSDNDEQERRKKEEREIRTSSSLPPSCPSSHPSSSKEGWREEMMKKFGEGCHEEIFEKAWDEVLAMPSGSIRSMRGFLTSVIDKLMIYKELPKKAETNERRVDQIEKNRQEALLFARELSNGVRIDPNDVGVFITHKNGVSCVSYALSQGEWERETSWIPRLELKKGNEA